MLRAALVLLVAAGLSCARTTATSSPSPVTKRTHPPTPSCVVTIEDETSPGTRTYDQHGRLVAAKWTLRGDSPEHGKQSWEWFEYDASDRVIAAHSRSFLPAIDNWHSHREERRAAYDMTYSYDREGHLQRSGTTVTRDVTGTLVFKTVGDHYRHAFDYDSAGHLSSITTSFCEGSACNDLYSVQTTFDSEHRLTQLHDRGTTLDWEYGPSGPSSFELQSPRSGDSYKVEYAYTSSGSLESERYVTRDGERVRRYRYGAACAGLVIADFPWFTPEIYLSLSGPYECVQSPMGALFTCRSIVASPISD